MRLGDSDVPLIDRDVPTVFADVLTEARYTHNVFYFSFAQSVTDQGNSIELQVQCRLRLNLFAAQLLRDNLSHLIEEANKPPDRSKAN